MIQIFQKLKDSYQLKKESKINRNEVKETKEEVYEELENLYKKYSKKSKEEDVYYLLGSCYIKNLMTNTNDISKIKNEIIPLLEECDQNNMTIPYDLGLWLEEKLQDPTVQIGIHYTGTMFDENPYKDRIIRMYMQVGLINSSQEEPLANQAIISCSNIVEALKKIKSTYSNSMGVIILEFPSELVDDNLSFKSTKAKEEIYNVSGNQAIIKPEYILGYLKKGKPSEYISREMFLTYYKEEKKEKVNFK